MATHILQHNGVYNLWSANTDSVLINCGLSRDDLFNYEFTRRVNKARADILAQLKRQFADADERGTSEHGASAITDTVAINMMGPDAENPMPVDEILAKYFVRGD